MLNPGRSRAYLSIDIDYWNDDNFSIQLFNELLTSSGGENVQIVMNHQQMLPNVNKSNAECLINIDKHSDIVAFPQELDCGSWVSYVKWRRAGKYIWMTRDPIGGDCNSWQNVWKNSPWDQSIDWKESELNIGIDMDLINSYDIVGIGVSLSPYYTRCNTLKAVRPIVKDFPYKKGRVDDSYARKIKPSKAA